MDLPRAREGGLGGGFFAIFVPADPAMQGPEGSDLHISENAWEVDLAPPLDPAYAQRHTIAMMARLFRMEAESAGEVRIVRKASELDDCLRQSVLAIVLHFEGAEAIDSDLNALDVFYAAGLRSLGIVWSRPNAFGHGVPFKFPASPDTGPGLTGAGRALVRVCNQLGILVDLAHINERGFWDVANLSTAPLVVTHAAAHALCPITRNLTDQQIDAIGATDGVIGVNFEVSALRADSHDDPDTPLTEIVRHIDYIAARIGIDHVAFVSDFDGARMPAALGDVSGLPRLIATLSEHGYDEPALRKLTYQNWLRVLRATWK